MTQRMGAKGQVVIPKELRDRVGLHPGAEVEFAQQGDRVTVMAAKQPARLGGSLRGPDMAARLLEDRRREPR